MNEEYKRDRHKGYFFVDEFNPKWMRERSRVKEDTAQTKGCGWAALCNPVRSSGLFQNQRRIDQVLPDKPRLQLIWPQNVADDHVVGAVVARLVGGLGDVGALLDDDLVRLEQPRDLHGHLFPAFGGA